MGEIADNGLNEKESGFSVPLPSLLLQVLLAPQVICPLRS